MKKEYKLTQYSHGAGCGCKISPKVLDAILKTSKKPIEFPSLLVGNADRDDAAVMDMGDGTAIISTTDFFMPIVDDPFDFGMIASVNAISDIYAMGGTPLMAIAILGWPINELPPEVANEVIEGGRAACMKAGIPLAGGHSIDSPEPIFGLAVSGKVDIAKMKKNGGAKIGDQLFLTKPLGVGILTTATKKGLLEISDNDVAKISMSKLNSIGESYAQLPGVHAMTDVTGFGLLGHLIEMCEASDLSAEIDAKLVPIIPEAHKYLDLGCVPGGTKRNWDSYGHKVGPISDSNTQQILSDPQTSGGLLVAVTNEEVAQFKTISKEQGLELIAIGSFIPKASSTVIVA